MSAGGRDGTDGIGSGLGLRPTVVRVVRNDQAPRVVAPSADALTDARWRRLVEQEPRSWVHAMQPATAHGGDLGAALAASRETVDHLLAEGAFGPTRGPRYLWYRLATGDHAQTGLVAEVPVAAYERGLVLRHEETRPERLAELAAYRRVVGVASSPVALAHPAVTSLRELSARAARRTPAVDLVTTDGSRHTLWSVPDADEVAAIRAAAGSVDRAWIVDGHHRFAAAAAVAADPDARRASSGAVDRVLAVLFPFDELRVLPFHRVVDLGTTTDEARRRLARVGRLTRLGPGADPGRLRSHGAWAVCLEGAWHRLDLDERGSGTDDDGDLDVVSLQQRVLAPALGVHEPRTDDRLTHLAGDVEDLATACRAPGRVGVVVRPVPVDRLAAIAAAGRMLPPKSTRFAPKVRSGLLLRHLRPAERGCPPTP